MIHVLVDKCGRFGGVCPIRTYEQCNVPGRWRQVPQKRCRSVVVNTSTWKMKWY